MVAVCSTPEPEQNGYLLFGGRELDLLYWVFNIISASVRALYEGGGRCSAESSNRVGDEVADDLVDLVHVHHMLVRIPRQGLLH